MNHKRFLLALPLIASALVFFQTAEGGVRGSAITPAGARTAASIESSQRELYIVQFADPPALAAHGSRSSLLGATAAESGFDPQAAPVRTYLDQLQRKQKQILQSLNLEQNRIYSYGYTFNGVAILLTREEADKLRLRRGVQRVWQDSRRSVATDDGPAFLGLLDASGGLRADLGLTGENVIIGVIDSGITPNHPSFADRGEKPRQPRVCNSTWAKESLLGLWLCSRLKKPARLEYSSPPPGWRGVCETGPGFPAGSCNNKLIGARAYSSGFNQLKDIDPGEFDSPADADGHGTHIASIAAGNSVSASVFGKDAGRISGIAPRARVAVYKACWLEPGASRATCSMADLQMAIEDAVADGVNIINYSIGDTNDSLDDPDDLALLAATEAGVLSVVASGNDGPDPFTIQSPATTPWVISVGATSRAGTRIAEALRINSPAALAKDYESREAGFTPRLDDVGPLTAELVLADDGTTETPTAGETGSVYDGCTALVNADEMNGNIALIQRGYCTFDQKIANAEAAGAIAVVVYSNDMDLIVMDGDEALVDVPAVMIGQADGELIRDKLLDGETVSITLDKSLFLNLTDAGNVLGAYSGRGPNFADSDFLKPDVVAPGTAILGAQTPQVANGFKGELYQYLSGTSQSAPHVAGTAALLKQAHPDWTPAELKSALMTSSRQNILREDGSTPATPFDMGAGHIVPNNAIDPGLLYPVAIQEYDAYLCTVGLQRVSDEQCTQLALDGYTQDARDINLPSVAITELAGSVTVTRRVTNPGPAAQFSVETSVPDGISLEVNPSSLSLGSGESAEYTLRFSSDGTGLDQWHYGNISWVNDTHRVYSPFVVQPTLFSAADVLHGKGAAGSVQVPVSFGYDGSYAARINGLFLPCVLPDSDPSDALCTNTEAALVTDDPQDNYVFSLKPPSSVRRFFINVPATDNELLRIRLLDEMTSGADDLDVYLYYCPATATPGVCTLAEDGLVSLSATPDTSDEQIDVLNPAAGTWVVDVHGYATESSEGSRFRLYAWSFGSDNDAGNTLLTSVPATATAGTTAALTLSWNGLTPGLWLGGIAHYDNPADPEDIPLALTVIEVDN